MIQHLLFDADGVLQDLAAAWRMTLEPHLGEQTEDFLLAVWARELPMLAGKGGYLQLLSEILLAYGVTTPADAMYEQVLQCLQRFEESFRVVAACRTAGYGIHLGTNQDFHSAAYMAEVLGYDAIFDISCYSCNIGVAKPDIGFFEVAARRIGANPVEILFIDDNALNVEAAVAGGLNAIQWSTDDGLDSLLAMFGEHGIGIDFR